MSVVNVFPVYNKFPLFGLSNQLIIELVLLLSANNSSADDVQLSFSITDGRSNTSILIVCEMESEPKHCLQLTSHHNCHQQQIDVKYYFRLNYQSHHQKSIL